MKIRINRFCLRHEEKTYKKGDIVEIANEETAKMIVANSGGDFSIYHPEDEEAETKTPVAPKKKEESTGENGGANETGGKSPEEGTTGGGTDQGGGDSEGDEGGLPNPDVDGSVNP